MYNILFINSLAVPHINMSNPMYNNPLKEIEFLSLKLEDLKQRRERASQNETFHDIIYLTKQINVIEKQKQILNYELSMKNQQLLPNISSNYDAYRFLSNVLNNSSKSFYHGGPPHPDQNHYSNPTRFDNVISSRQNSICNNSNNNNYNNNNYKNNNTNRKKRKRYTSRFENNKVHNNYPDKRIRYFEDFSSKIIISGYTGKNSDISNIYVNIFSKRYPIVEFFKRKVCYYYQTSECKNPETCTFYHVCTLCLTLDNSKQKKCKCKDNSNGLCDAPKFSCPKKLTCKKTHTHSESIAWIMNDNYTKFKTSMCRFKNKCHSTKCKFAHSYKDIRCIICESTICVGGQCKRNPYSRNFLDPLDYLNGLNRLGLLTTNLDSLKIYD